MEGEDDQVDAQSIAEATADGETDGAGGDGDEPATSSNGQGGDGQKINSLSPALASRRKVSSSNRRQLSDHQEPSSTPIRPSPISHNSSSNNLNSSRDRPPSRLSGMDRKLSDPEQFGNQPSRSTSPNPTTNSDSNQLLPEDELISSSALESHTAKLKSRRGGKSSGNGGGGGNGKGVSFKYKKLGPGERPQSSRAKSSHHGLIGVPRSNSGFDLENQTTGIDGNQQGGSGLLNGNGGMNSNQASTTPRRSAGMISKSEMPPRKFGTWDGVFMPVSLNVSVFSMVRWEGKGDNWEASTDVKLISESPCLCSLPIDPGYHYVLTFWIHSRSSRSTRSHLPTSVVLPHRYLDLHVSFSNQYQRTSQRRRSLLPHLKNLRT